MARKILVPEEELHSIADAINNRAEYLEDMNGDEDHTIQNSMVRNSDKQMQTANMADNIMKMYVDLSRFYTKDEIDQIIKEKAIKLVFGALPESGEENTFYFINSYDAETEILDMSVYIWQYEEFVKASDLKVDLSVYATKVDVDSAIDSLQDVYQRKLTPGDGIQIDESTDTISAYDYKLVQSDFDDPDDGLFKFKRAINDDPEHVPALIVKGEGPVVTFHESDNTLHIDIDTSKLEVVTPPTDDRSTKIATTEFVYNVLDKIDLTGVVHYVIVDDSDYDSIEEDDDTDRQEGTLYLYPKFETVYFGDTEIAGSIKWKILEENYNKIFIKFKGEISGTEDVVYSYDLRNGYMLDRYQDIFKDPWQREGTVDWKFNDYILQESDVSIKDVLKICEELGITVPKKEDIGSEDNPAIIFEPQFSTLEVPWYGYSKNEGYLVVNRSVNVEQGVVSKLSNHTYFNNTVTPNQDKLGTKILDSALDFNAVPLSTDSQFDPAKYADSLIYPGHTLRGWYFDNYVDIESILPILTTYTCSEQDSSKTYIDISYDDSEYSSYQIDLYYNNEMIPTSNATWEWVDPNIRVYSSIFGDQFNEGDIIEIKPKADDFNINPKTVNVDWSGIIYAIWKQEEYTDISRMWMDYINVPGDDLISGSSSVTFYYEVSKSEGGTTADQGFRYTVIPVASGQYSSNSYVVSNYKDTLGIFDTVFENRDFSEEPITLQEYMDSMSNGISEYIDENQMQFVEFEDLSDSDFYRWSKTIPISNTNVLCIYIQRYSMDGQNIVVEESYAKYIKGFTTSSNIVYDLREYSEESTGPDE